MRLEFLKHLHGLLGNSTLHALENDKLLEWSAVEQFYFTAPALLDLSVTLRDGTGHPVPVEQPARIRTKVVELDDEVNAARAKAAYAVEL